MAGKWVRAMNAAQDIAEAWQSISYYNLKLDELVKKHDPVPPSWLLNDNLRSAYKELNSCKDDLTEYLIMATEGELSYDEASMVTEVISEIIRIDTAEIYNLKVECNRLEMDRRKEKKKRWWQRK